MGIREKLTHKLSLPKEIALDLPLLVALGREELNVENYKHLLAFSDTLVRVHTAAGVLCVEGANMQLKQMTSENLLITGNITATHWE